MTATKEAIAQVLNGVIDPNTGKGLQDSGEIASVLPGAVIIELGYPAKSQIELIKKAAEDALRAAGIDSEVEVRQNIRAHKVRSTLRVLPNVKNIIAVSSGKGGVGKSTVTANLALALASEGAKVGVLDADIYGPSQPTMLGASGTPQSKDGKTMEPIEANGLQINSIGFMVNPADPVIWRGPMVSSALRDLLQQTNWHDLDYLVIDMPPGTGDIQLTLSQQVPVTGAIVVTTPQDIATLDAVKGLMMFRKVNIPVLGKTWRSSSAPTAVTLSGSSVKAERNGCPRSTVFRFSAASPLSAASARTRTPGIRRCSLSPTAKRQRSSVPSRERPR